MNEIVIRSAVPEDVAEIAALINEFAARNLMLPRSEEAILRTLPDWLVAVERSSRHTESADGRSQSADAHPANRIVGCGALAALTEELAEIRSLAVHESQHGKGLGSMLVERLVALARAREFEQVCALTLRENFFTRMGFRIVDRWSISPKLWQECIYCPKFHRCDEVAVLMNLSHRPVEETEADVRQPAAWNGLLKWRSWQPLKLAYNRKPIHLEE